MLVPGCRSSTRSPGGNGNGNTTAPPEANPAKAGALAGVSTVELIDSLVNLSSKDYAVRTNIIAGGPLRAPLIMLQDPGPKPSDAMQELVRRGALAVPYLVKHLGDTRPTQVPVPRLSGQWFGYEYDYNRSTTRPPPGVNAYGPTSQPQSPPTMPGAFAVGDICFDLLGEIVNRGFESVRYQPTMCIVVNCPTVLKEVRDAATREWGTLTPELHRQRLMEDVSHPDRPERAKEARKLLARYYPDNKPQRDGHQ